MSRRAADSPLPFSKAMAPTDFPDLQPQLQMMAHYPDLLHGQHEVRRWEYAMALRAISTWSNTREGTQDPLQILDVGGAGSNFWQVLTVLTSEDIIIVDPSVPGPATQPFAQQVQTFPVSIEDFAATGRHDRFDVVTCISVIEHVKEVRKFFRAIKMLLKPGGLVFLTTDYWGAEGEDTAHFHWMRERIYNAEAMRRLFADLRELGYRSFGPADWTYHGPQLYDYAVCSAALVRRER